MGPVLLFITWYGKGLNMRGYIFVGSPNEASPQVPKSIEVLGPNPCLPGVVSFEADIVDDEGGGWYAVSRDY